MCKCLIWPFYVCFHAWKMYCKRLRKMFLEIRKLILSSYSVQYFSITAELSNWSNTGMNTSFLVMYPYDGYSLIQKNGDTFATVYNIKCVTVFMNQTIFLIVIKSYKVLVVMIRKTTKPDERPPLASLLLVWFIIIFSECPHNPHLLVSESKDHCT